MAKKMKNNPNVMTDGVNFYHKVGEGFKQLHSDCVLSVEEWGARGFSLTPVQEAVKNVRKRKRNTVQKDTESDRVSERDSEDE